MISPRPALFKAAFESGARTRAAGVPHAAAGAGGVNGRHR